MFAKQRLYLNADKNGLVSDGDPKAAFLYAAIGDEIPKSAAERFGLVDGKLPRARQGGKSGKSDMLLGSSQLPAMVEIGADKSVQLGNIVARAHKASGLDVEAWNGLPEDEREVLLAQMVETFKAEAAAKPAKAVKAKPARARKTAAAKEQAPAENKEDKSGGDKERKPGEDKGKAGNQSPAGDQA